MSCPCPRIDEVCDVLKEMDIFKGIRDLHLLIFAYSPYHGIRQPYQESDDEPFEEKYLDFPGRLTYTYDWFLSFRGIIIRNWSLTPSLLDGFTRLNETKAHRVHLGDYIFSVNLDDSRSFHIIGLDPKKDGEKIMRYLWEYGTEYVKSKLCGDALKSLGIVPLDPSTAHKCITQQRERVAKQLEQKRMQEEEERKKREEDAFHFAVDLPPVQNDNDTYESTLDRLRQKLEIATT